MIRPWKFPFFPMDNFIATLAIWALPVLLAITLHEAAHGYVARRYGDPTAWMMGRISLNPLRHIDPVGTLLVPGVLLGIGLLAGSQPLLFGWAKAVPVNFGNLRHPKKDMLWVAAAGPGANLLMAMAWAALAKLTLSLPLNPFTQAMVAMADAGMQVNVMLMVVNLIPIPPLDGGRIAVSLLPMKAALSLARVEPYGFFILIALLYTRVLDVILSPLFLLVFYLLGTLFQL